MAASAGGFAFTTSPSSLLSSPIALSALREDAWRELTRTLEQLPGEITLVLDGALESALKVMVADGLSALRECRVTHVCTLTEGPAELRGDTLCYLSAPLPSSMRLISAQVKGEVRRPKSKRYMHVALTPRRTFVAESILKEEGVLAGGAGHGEEGSRPHTGEGSLAVVTLSEYSGLDILPLDDDIAVTNTDRDLADVLVNGDTSPLYNMTRALLKMQDVFGPFARIRSKGPLAGAIVDLMLRLRREMGRGDGDAPAAIPTSAATSTATASGGSGGGLSSAVAGFNIDRASADTRSMAAHVVLPASAGGDKSGGDRASGQRLGEIDTCIILDRTVDMVTPFVSPLTYEALVDEIWGLKCGMIELDSSIVADDDDDDAPVSRSRGAAKPTTTLMHFNSNIKLYTELRDCNFQSAGPRLQQKAREIQSLRDSITKSKAADLSVSDIRKFVKQIPGLQFDMKFLKILINMTTEVQKYANDAKFMEGWQLERSIVDEDNAKGVADALTAAINTKKNLKSTLKLLCLCSAVEGGLRLKQLDLYRRAIVQTYGFEAISSLRSLEAAGVLKAREGSEGLAAAFSGSTSNWSQLRKVLALTAEDVNVEEPTDLHYCTSGYAPLSVRLIQGALGLLGASGGSAATGSSSGGSGVSGGIASAPGGGSWDGGVMADVLKLLPGPVWNVTQTLAGSSTSTGAGTSGVSGESGSGPARKVVLLVFFGGITHIELSCLRFLSERTPVDFVILARCVTNGIRLISNLAQPLTNNYEPGAEFATIRGAGATLGDD